MTTKDWKMGHYPGVKKVKLNVKTALEQLELFNHRQAARVLFDALVRSGGISCTCGDMLRNPSVKCMLHKEVRVRTFNERMDFEKAFDAKIKADKEKHNG